MVKTYRVESLGEIEIYTSEELRELAMYYYNNSEVEEEIDFNTIQNCIDFVNRVDKVSEL